METAEKLKILEEAGGIAAPYRAFYEHVVDHHILEFERLLVSFRLSAPTEKPAFRVLMALDAIRHAAIISRYAFPSRHKALHELRSGAFRQMYGITSASALADRSLRNAIEHFDERFDHYLFDECVGAIIPFLVYDGWWGESDLEGGHLFLGVNRDFEQVIVLNEMFDVRPLRQQMAELAVDARERQA